MMRFKYIFFVALIFLSVTFGYSQSIVGKVLDANSQQPLETVAIYYDGTTIGTVTNDKGQFNLSSEVATQAIVVVSYLGYETQYFTQEQLKTKNTIYLSEKAEALDAVYIEDDNWSREKKMRYFKQEFFGKLHASLDCKILNESAIKLIYIPSKRLLLATADVPIQIKNDHLGYQVNYNIVDFEIQFKVNLSGWERVESVYYSGTSSFTELNEKIKRKHLKAREAAYKGSILQFMRALSKKELLEQKFETFINDTIKGSEAFFPVQPYEFLEVSKSGNGLHQIEIKRDKVVVLYNKDVQSALIPMDSTNRVFYIDDYGIHSPVDKLFFTGDFGLKRISTMLPLDFELEEKD